MTEIRIRPGPYQPDTQLPSLLGRDPPPGGRPDQPFSLYDGPYGPLEAYAVDGLTATVVTGPALGQPVRLAWGPDAKADPNWLHRLTEGLGCRIGTTDVVIRQARLGLTRAKRGVHVEAGPRRLVARLRRLRTYVVERADGAAVARYPAPGDELGWLDDAADQLDAVVVFLLDASLLRLECSAGNS